VDNHIYIMGQKHEVKGAPNGVVTWKDKRSLDLKRLGTAQYLSDPISNPGRGWGARKGPDGRVGSLEDLKAAISQIILHWDVTHTSAGAVDVLQRRGLSTHFLIDSDGTIYQTLDVEYKAVHAGEANDRSIGIDLNHVAHNLLRTPKEGHTYGRRQQRDGPSPPVRINGVQYRSYGYTDAQYQALIALLTELMGSLDIPKNVPLGENGEVRLNILEEDDANSFKGLLAHWHLSAEKWDPGPAFDWDRVMAAISDTQNSFPIPLSGVPRSMTELRDPQKFRAAAEQYYRNTETARKGGTYPVGRYQNWHGGTHFFVKRGTPVQAMFSGTLVLAHFSDDPTVRGSNNFVVLRHEVPMPARPDEDEKTLRFYSLYMHLGPLTFSMDSKTEQPDWLRTMLEAEAAAAKPGAKKERADSRDTDDRDSESDETERRNPILMFTKGSLQALREGKVAMFKPGGKKAIQVTAGTTIGFSGELGTEDEREELVHVEIFTDSQWTQAVSGGGHRRYFEMVSEDLERSLLVRSKRVLADFRPGARLRGRGLDRRILDEDEIMDFYDSEPGPALQRMRAAATRHVSEWSDQVDWFRALFEDPDKGSPKNWGEVKSRLRSLMRGPKRLKAESAYLRVLEEMIPFIWLTEDTAKHIGLEQKPWKGVLYHFHPVHFLWWRTFKIKNDRPVIYKSMSRKRLAQLKRKERKEQEEKRRRGELDENMHGEEIELFEIDSGESHGEELDELRELEVPGSWPLPRTDD